MKFSRWFKCAVIILSLTVPTVSYAQGKVTRKSNSRPYIDKSKSKRKSTKLQGTPEELCEKGSYYLYDKGDYKTALGYLRQASNGGSPEAKYLLYVMYDNGWGVTENKTQAAEYLIQAAENGCADAQYWLSHYYELDRGYGSIKHSYVQSLYWAQRAAEQERKGAAEQLGRLYFYGGDGVNPDFHKALQWFHIGESDGHGDASYYLGYMNMKGLGVAKSYSEALKFFSKASDGYSRACNLYIGNIYYEGGYGITKDDRKALEYWLKAAEAGSDAAKDNIRNKLGINY